MKTKDLSEVPHGKVISAKRYKEHMDFHFEDGIKLRVYADSDRLPTFHEAELLSRYYYGEFL